MALEAELALPIFDKQEQKEAKPPSPWTPEKVEQLLKLFHEGHSCSSIGGQIGLSRNAVIGKLHRMGLTKPKPEASLIQKTARKPRREGSNVIRFSPRAELYAERAATVVPLCIELVDLEPHHCRYPYLSGPYVFCGHRKQEGSSYCPEHYALTWQPTRSRA